MNSRITWRWAVAVAPTLLLAASVSAAQESTPLPFAPGEKLTYSVNWSVFPAGQVTTTLQRVEDPGGDAYEVTATAQSRGVVSLLYNLNDEFRSLFSPATLCSRSISKTVNEGHRRKRTRIVFDGEKKLAILDERDLAKPGAPAKHIENAAPACVEDVVSAFYYARRQPFRAGEKFEVPVNDGNKTVTVTVEVQAREAIDTPLGRRYAWRVEPKVFGQLYKRKGRMLVWFSDDAQRLPLRVKAMISVGTITGDLQSVTQAAPDATPSTARLILP